MPIYKLVQANNELFATYYAVYSDADFDMCYDWNERLVGLRLCKDYYFLYRDKVIIGGLIITLNTISNPFLVAPFTDRELFWNIVLKQMGEITPEENININNLHQLDVDVLLACGASKKWSQQRMNRPTEILEVKNKPEYKLSVPSENDIPEIVQVVYSAHVHDFTAQTYGEPNYSDVKKAIERRFVSFSQTNTLHLSIVAKESETSKVVGVCIAGIYPDSPNNFSTIHQVSVLPCFRRQGIAEMMMTHTISIAHSVSPVIGLGVLVGNPAANLYRKLGFVAKSSFTDLVIKL
jgi:ribosomal protein S18 acetylase RimI-like enzyme